MNQYLSLIKSKNISINVRTKDITIATSNTKDHKFCEKGSKKIVHDITLSSMVLIKTSALVWNKHGNKSNALVLGTVCVVLKLE